jgi:hypothetical protein
MKFKANIYNRMRKMIDSAEFETWQDAIKWLQEWAGVGRKWSEILPL